MTDDRDMTEAEWQESRRQDRDEEKTRERRLALLICVKCRRYDYDGNTCTLTGEVCCSDDTCEEFEVTA